MERKKESLDSSPFSRALALNKLELPCVPPSYVLPPSQRPNPSLALNTSTSLPIIDLLALQDPSLRSQTIEKIMMACKEIGFFQVINHGIPPTIMSAALDVADEFFNLPMEDKVLLMSDDVHEPVRYGTSLNYVKDKVHFWRDFIKHYSHPIRDWIHLWPSKPLSYKEKMGDYAKAVQVLQKQLMEVVLESLGLNPNYSQKDIDEGLQVLAVNCYPACPEPELVLGMPPHSDYGSLTILLQSGPGLQFMEQNENWLPVPAIEGALIVQLGDQMEVMSNGQYKSVIHRATVSSDKKRIAIASLHCLALNTKMRPAPELVDKQPKSYNEFSFRDFLDFISKNDITNERFINTLKTNI